jgi:hypothetical protein
MMYVFISFALFASIGSCGAFTRWPAECTGKRIAVGQARRTMRMEWETHWAVRLKLLMTATRFGERCFSFGLFHAWLNNSTGCSPRSVAVLDDAGNAVTVTATV